MKLGQKSKHRPVMIAVRLLASIPSVTCSAVEEDPNPLSPGLPVTNEKIPAILSSNNYASTHTNREKPNLCSKHKTQFPF